MKVIYVADMMPARAWINIAYSFFLLNVSELVRNISGPTTKIIIVTAF
jgi:hypothetical protein